VYRGLLGPLKKYTTLSPYEKWKSGTKRQEVQRLAMQESFRADKTLACEAERELRVVNSTSGPNRPYRYHADYRAVLWVWAGTHNAFISGFVAIADLLDLPEKDEWDQNCIVEAVMRWFRINSDWLLIFDNVDDLTVASKFIPVLAT
jgi:hypothetical protein